jgi:hypothetical protein
VSDRHGYPLVQRETKYKSKLPYLAIPLAREKQFRPKHNQILLNIENNDPFLTFSFILENSHNCNKPYYTLKYLV